MEFIDELISSHLNEMIRFDLKAITFFDEDEHLMSILSPDYTITYFPLYFRAEGVRIALELTK